MKTLIYFQNADTFGHSANLPEIDGFGGVKYYYHCRGLDDQTLYRWRAPSGAEVLAYCEPFWYNGSIDGDFAEFAPAFCERFGVEYALRVYGVGDHGGGPTRRDILRALDMQTWPIYAAVEFGTFHRFFESAEKGIEKAPIVERELNPLFLGCYTTQSRIKKGNRYAERILDLKGNLDRELDDIVSANNETLRIGFSSIRGSDFILGIVPRFTALHPNVHLQLSEVNYTTFENTLLSGQLDIVLFNLPIKNPGIEYQILAYDEIVLVAPSNHPIVSMAEKREECNYPWVDLRWLQDEQFIMVSKELRLHAIVESLFEQAGFTPKIHFYTRNLEAASMLVAEGYGLTFTNIKYISHLTFKHQPAFFSIGSPSTFRTFVAGYRKNAYLSPAAQDIIRLSKNI